MKENQTPAYYAYVGLLRRLHQLISEGAGDTAAADDVRDAMDLPWAQMTPLEVAAANRLSAQLYRDPSPQGFQPGSKTTNSRWRVRFQYMVPRKAA